MVFVDTSALAALADRRDHNHQAAADFVRGLPRAAGRLVTTNYVLDETFTLLRHTIGLAHTVAFGEALMQSRLYTIVQVDPRVQRLAWEWFKRYTDKDFSFTDCTSFVVMKAMCIEEAFAFDRHFVQAGFACRPG